MTFGIKARPVLLFLLLLLAVGCERDDRSRPPSGAAFTAAAPEAPGCRRCHAIEIDPAHDFACAECHGGDEQAAGKTEAHQELVARPAHPRQLAKTCGRCHADLAGQAARSLHFTLKNEVNMVRRAFGASEDLPSLTDIPIQEPPATLLGLADDLLRRRCLRCHVYYEGDPYPETRRGTGCAACHLRYGGGMLRSHRFVRLPADDQCLHCHYANTVGFDYHGRYEQDFHWDYRTPFPVSALEPRPYGVEYHQLATDVHQRAGIECIDCHGGGELMGSAHGTGSASRLTCESCHVRQPRPTIPNLEAAGDKQILITRRTGRRIKVPLLAHPAHRTYGKQATCVLCHARWSFNDQGTHLMRQDIEDYGPWLPLATQSCAEVEDLLAADLAGLDACEPRMTDKVSGELRPGLWYKGFGLRRWELPRICRDEQDRLTICRPVLDLFLSYVNSEEQVLFDSVPAPGAAGGVLPYTPHTIGKAGAFFRQRLQEDAPLSGKGENH